MLCPESPEVPEIEDEVLQQETKIIDKEENRKSKENRSIPVEGAGGVDFNSFRNPKTWKKSISMFFRNQLRSTRSNDGDGPSGSNEQFPEENTISPEQKWQSLGKMFRRQTLGDHCNKPGSPEDHPHKKSAAVKKVWAHYFGKTKSSPSPVNELTDEKK